MPDRTQVLRIKKLIGAGVIRMASKHNLREQQAEIGADGERIDATRSSLNVILAGADTAAEVSDEAKRLMAEAGVKPLRKDAVRGLELVITLPPTTTIDQPAFFRDSLAWASRFYALPILSAAIHNDETAPHIHIIVLPLVGAKMNGSHIAAKGDQKRWLAWQTSFNQQVGKLYGLTMPTPARRHSAGVRDTCASLSISSIASSPELLNDPEVIAALEELVRIKPDRLMAALKLKIPLPTSNKSFVEIMTKNCPEKKPKPVIVSTRQKPVLVSKQPAKKTEANLCDSFAARPPPIPPTKRTASPVLDADDDDFSEGLTRYRDDAPPTGVWSQELGEFVTARHAQDSATRLHGGRPC